MIAELTAIGSFGVLVLGSAWKLHQHFDSRLDRMESERSLLQAQVQLIEYRITQLEQQNQEVKL